MITAAETMRPLLRTLTLVASIQYWERRVPADARFVMRHLSETRGAGRNRLFELFPHGYPGEACRIAGMRRPRVWSTG